MQAQSLKTSGHAAFRLQFHVVFVTKYRHCCLTAEMLTQMREQMTRVCKSWRCALLEFNGEADHVHLLIDGHPAVNFARMVGNLKTVSARHMRAMHATHLKVLLEEAVLGLVVCGLHRRRHNDRNGGAVHSKPRDTGGGYHRLPGR
jgi:putative transposase